MQAFATVCLIGAGAPKVHSCLWRLSRLISTINHRMLPTPSPRPPVRVPPPRRRPHLKATAPWMVYPSPRRSSPRRRIEWLLFPSQQPSPVSRWVPAQPDPQAPVR